MEQKLYDIKSRQKMKIKKRKEAMVQLLEQVSDVVLTDLFLMADPEYYFNRYSEDARR
jgi:hypothetical protein